MKDTRDDFLPFIATADGRIHNLSYKLIAFQEKKKGDHVHCELCWLRISEYAYDDPESEREGYYCEETRCWLCKKCFSDFSQKFDWRVEN